MTTPAELITEHLRTQRGLSPVGALIAYHLQWEGITAADVERRVGLSKSFVGKLINKPRADRPVTPATLRRLADAIKADLHELTMAELESCGYAVKP